MDIVSAGPLPASALVWQPRPGAWVLTVVAKATYLLRPGECALGPSQESPAAEDRYAGDDPARALLRPRDLVPAKPLADVILTGSAFAPERRATRSIVARLAVGEIDKRIEIMADRWLGPSGAVTEGAPFVQMPLGYERAAGGPPNPIGVTPGARDAEGRMLLPNLQRVGAAVGAFEPIGFGPISPSWPERRERLGPSAASFSFHDLASRPLPEGMDLGYFNAAPRDQQVRAISPSETITLEHLHPDPEHARLITRLPGLVARATLEGRRSGPVAIAMRADTLAIDTDRALLTLTFRGMVPLESADEPGRVTVTMAQAPAGSEASGVIRAPEIPHIARPPRALQATADIPLSARQAAVLPFSPRASESREAPASRPDPVTLAAARPAPVESPWASAPPPRIVEAPPPLEPPAPRPPVPSALEASNAAAGAEPLRVSAPAPRPEPLAEPQPRSAPRGEAREALELVWFDVESVPRFRRKPAWRSILDVADKAPLDPDFDDPAMAKDPMFIEDRREVFEILARAEPSDLAALEAAFIACQRGDGKFVPALALFAGELEMPFDELSSLRATISTVTPLVGSDEALKGTIDTAKELLALPDLMAAPAVAEGLTRRIEQAFSSGKRAVPADYLETIRERVLLEQRRYQRRAVLGDKHLRALLRLDGESPAGKSAPAKPASAVVTVYLPEGVAALLPLSPRFRARFLAEIRLAADPGEAHPAALRVLALARAVPALKR